MLRVLQARLQQRHRTIAFPQGAPVLPERYRGLPVLDPTQCATDCRACVEVCPTQALSLTGATGSLSASASRASSQPPQLPSASKDEALGTPSLRLDLGRCLFCTECTSACPTGAVSYSREFRLAARSRQDLVATAQAWKLADALEARTRRLFGRSLKLRQVSAGGCNACEADVNVLNTIVFDLGRFGIQFVAAPRHADGLLITGPVTENMKLALQKTYAAVPSPKLVIAVGACAISGGPYVDHPEVHNGADPIVPVDLYIPGCPPHPLTILDGLLRLLGRLDPTVS